MITLYKNQSGKIGYWQIEVTDNAELKISHARSMEGKATTRFTEVTGKNIGRANETSPMEQAQLELESRVRKQLDKGYVQDMRDAEKPVTNTLGLLKPTLAVVFEKFKTDKIDWITAYLQKKFDGHRCLYKDGILYSRGGKEINLPHIKAEIERLGLQDKHLDGELYLHNTPLQTIGSWVKKLQPESLQLQYHIYDVVDLEDQFATRFIDGLEIGESKTIFKVETVAVASEDECRLLNHINVEEGYEGSIIRWGTLGYQTDKRSTQLLKMKGYIEAEAKILGFRFKKPVLKEDGRRYEVICFVLENQYGGENFEVTAPGSELEVHRQAVEAENYVGKQMTFKYFALSEGKVPQQPIALRVREDL